MNLVSFALVMTGVFLNAIAQIMLKLGGARLGPQPFAGSPLDIAVRVFSQWPYLVGFGCYAISLVVWIVALTRVPVSIAYPMLSVGYVLNALIARFWLGETVSTGAWSGIALICVGVTLIARSH